MPSKNTSEFILLSELINILKDKEYYQTFAKTIAMTSNSKNPMPSDDEVVAEMFRYFIQTDLLQIFREKALVTLDSIESEVDRRILKNTESENSEDNLKNTIHDDIWKNEIYINIKELKKLYANKCIVFPNSLLTELSTQENL
ncbi:MAG: hypothetical protein GKR92_05270 [Gammaproteobacteria bacterium]|nr:MAG: hypothetical protein GKR92_05270 [Gammaproteobacteria bacterium]